MALRGYLAEVKASSTPIVFTDEATTTSDDTTYIISDNLKSVWDLGTEVVVKDGGIATTESYNVSRLNGQITFETADAGRVITVSGAYVALSTVATAKEFSFSGSADALENTVFQSQFRTYQAGLVTGTADLGRFFVADDLFRNMLLNREIKVIYYYPNNTEDPIRFFAVANSSSVESPVEGLVEESLSFNVTTEIEV